MQLDALTLTNFKNISQAQLIFSPKINCLLGNNGMGKSNLLDAIYMLSFCKSFSGAPDSMIIHSQEDFAIAKGHYTRRNIAEELTLGLKRGKRKTLKRGSKEYLKLSAHIGTFPLVMAAPQDIDLIRGAGEERRRWMDMVISQSDPHYLDALIRYNNALEQRNKLLRDSVVDHNLYAAVECVMDMAAAAIYSKRAKWTDRLSAIFHRLYSAIAGTDENVSLRYISTLDSTKGSLLPLLDSARRHDEIVRHTSVGPHRDDIEMLLDTMPMRRIGSQGQCKTFTVALRMAQYEFLHQATGLRPLLLLDDIFDKLDASRVESIMNLVTSDEFGQIFITDTDRSHLHSIVSRASGGDHRMWTVSNGTFTPEH